MNGLPCSPIVVNHCDCNANIPSSTSMSVKFTILNALINTKRITMRCTRLFSSVIFFASIVSFHNLGSRLSLYSLLVAGLEVFENTQSRNHFRLGQWLFCTFSLDVRRRQQFPQGVFLTNRSLF